MLSCIVRAGCSGSYEKDHPSEVTEGKMLSAQSISKMRCKYKQAVRMMWNGMIAVMQISVCPFLQLEKPEDDLIQYSGELLVSARLSVPAQYKNFQFEGIKHFGIHESLD